MVMRFQKTSAARTKRGRHLHVLRDQQQLLAIVAIGDDAAEQREQQDGQLAEEVVQAEVEGRLGQVEDEPALRDLLHPGADGRRECAEPEDPEVTVGERRERAAEVRLDGQASTY